MRLTDARRACAYVHSLDRWKGEPLYVALIELLHRRGIAGATAARALQGFGSTGEMHAGGPFSLVEDVPVVVVFVDTPEVVEAVLPTISAMMAGRGVLTVNDVRASLPRES